MQTGLLILEVAALMVAFGIHIIAVLAVVWEELSPRRRTVVVNWAETLRATWSVVVITAVATIVVGGMEFTKISFLSAQIGALALLLAYRQHKKTL